MTERCRWSLEICRDRFWAHAHGADGIGIAGDSSSYSSPGIGGVVVPQQESVPVAGVQQGDETAHVRCVEFEQRADGTRKVEHAISGDSYPLWIDGGGAGDGP